MQLYSAPSHSALLSSLPPADELHIHSLPSSCQNIYEKAEVRARQPRPEPITEPIEQLTAVGNFIAGLLRIIHEHGGLVMRSNSVIVEKRHLTYGAL